MKHVACALVILVGALLLTGFVMQGERERTQQASASGRAPARAVPPLLLQEQIPVPNVAGRLDHFTVDVKRRRLIFAALGNNTVEVLDTFAGKVIHTITGLSAPQGVLYVPEFDELVVANAGDGKVRIYSGESYALSKTVDFGEDPDNLRYDAAAKKIYVGYGGDDGAIGAMDAATGERTGTDFKTGGHPESFQLDSDHIYVNVPDAGNVVQSIDRKSGAVAKWPLKSARSNFPMALDAEHNRLFTITRKPPVMVVLDTKSGREVARVPVAGNCDDVYFDASRRRVYVIGGQGFISVVQQDDSDHYHLVANVPSAIGVRTGFFYVKRDRLYVGLPATGNQPAQVWGYEAED